MRAGLVPVVVLVTLFMAIVVGGGAWLAQSSGAQSDDDSLQADVADLQTRVAALETQVAGGSTESTSDRHTISGVFETSCSGFIRPGEILTLKDEAGRIIGSAQLGPYLPDPGTTYDCAMEFTMTDVPEAEFYTFQWANFTVGTYPYAELESANWNITIAFV